MVILIALKIYHTYPQHVLQSLNGSFHLTIYLRVKNVLIFTLVPRLFWEYLQYCDVN